MISNMKTSIPGPESQKWLEKSYLYEPRCMTQQAPLIWERAKGVTVFDVDGNQFIDWTSGVLVTNVGHSHPEHVKSICKQVEKLMNCYDFPTTKRVELAEQLVNITPANLDKAFLKGVGLDSLYSAEKRFPELVFVSYQMMFAIITPALITGAFVNRVTFKAYVLFLILWQVFVYYPYALMIW